MTHFLTNLIRQHLIDPEICIRCNTCEESCPNGSITHDSKNYVVEFETCEWCYACMENCPTGAIDNSRRIPKERPYSVQEQLAWESLPPQT